MTADSILLFCRHSDIWFVKSDQQQRKIILELDKPFRNWFDVFFHFNCTRLDTSPDRRDSVMLFDTWDTNLQAQFSKISGRQNSGSSIFVVDFIEMCIVEFVRKNSLLHTLLRSFHDVAQMWHWKKHHLWMNGWTSECHASCEFINKPEWNYRR